MYQVLARKWRPQGFDQLVGQSQVSRTLSNAVAAGRLAHAYLFAGLRGTGKTTVARILAKCLNCEQGPTTTPCGRCAPCLEIAESRALDVLEIDAASRTKVEQTRELLEVVSYAPVRDRYKVLIIDEAHMLSKASFNALLKTLEEPPPNVVFLLATTEPQKILSTIVSRCQVFEFRRVGVAELVGHLRHICDAESITIPDPALERLARAGEGSVRDSLSLLERALAFCGLEIGEEDVLRLLGAVRAEVLVRWLEALAARDAGAMLGVLDGIVDEGRDLVQFWSALIAALRDVMVLRTLPRRSDLLGRSPEEAQALAQATSQLSAEDLTRAFQLVAELEVGLKASSQPRFLFEAALIRLASLGAVRPIEELLRALARTDAGEPNPAPPPAKKKPVDAVPAVTATLPVAAPPSEPEARPEAAPPRAGTDLAAALIDAVRAARPLLGAILGQAAAVEVRDLELVISFPAGMEALKRQLDAREALALLRQEAERLAGRRGLEVRVEVASGASGTQPQRAHLPPSAPGTGTPHDASHAEPGLRRLMDAFGAQVVEVRRADRPANGASAKTTIRPPEEVP